MKKYFFLLCLYLFLFSCKSRTNATVENHNTEIVDANEPIEDSQFLFDKIAEQPAFAQLKLNSTINVQSETSGLPLLDATIYIENGQKVWLNIAVFLNMARGIATPEGIKGYEKYNKTYIDSDFYYLNNLLNVNFIEFNALEKLLIGRTFITVDKEEYALTKNSQGYQLKSIKAIEFRGDNIVSDYDITLQYSDLLDLQRITMLNVYNDDGFEVIYSDWNEFETLRLPNNVKINIKGSKNSQIVIENTKFDTTEMQTPYNVPGNYTKVEIK